MAESPRIGVEGGQSSWAELLHGPLGLYTLLVNLGISLHAIDIFVISTLMPTVVADIGGVAYFAWAVMVYVVGSIVGAASFAPFAAATDSRRAFALGAVIYFAGSIACALAPEIFSFLAGRTVMGYGAGVALAGSYAFLGTLFEPRLRTRALAFNNATWTLATLIGPLLGGFFAQIAWWRGAFWAMVPVAVALAAIVWWKVPSAPARRDGPRQGMPYLRLALLGAGVLCVAAAGRIATAELRWVLVAVAPVVVWTAFHLDRTAENRLFPSRPLSIRMPVGTGYWIMFLVGAAQTTLYIYLPLVLQYVQGLEPIFVGLANAILSLGWTAGAALVAGWREGRERIALIWGPVLMIASIGGLVLDVAGASLWFIAIWATVFGFGMGMYNPHIQAHTMALAAKGEERVTSSSLATVRALGTAFGAAIAGLVANLAGLDRLAGAELVAEAVTWVLLWDLVPLAAAILLMLRFVQLLGRVAAQPAE